VDQPCPSVRFRRHLTEGLYATDRVSRIGRRRLIEVADLGSCLRVA
jgi:hypothetical protein